MFTTGFSTTPDGYIEEDTVSLEWMKKTADIYDCAIAGSIAYKDGDRNFNRLYFVKPGGEVTSYDKRHLFTYGGEHHRFTAGNERVTVSFRGVRFLLSVCYDLRFPVWLRNRDDYDAIICVASWPSVRRLAWDTLTRARAIENQCYVLAVNRTGEDVACKYNGGTVIINPYGETVEACRDGAADCISAELDMDLLKAYSLKFPVLEDADKFTLSI